jgi:hypothetical protein
MKKIVLASCVIAISGCVNVPVSTEAIGQSPTKFTSLSCSSPFLFTQDCSKSEALFGTRIIKIEKAEVAITATEDGKNLLMLDAHYVKHQLATPPFVFNSFVVSNASNAGYSSIKTALETHGVHIVKASPVVMFNSDIYGYVIELDTEGYSYLKKYTIN